MSSTHASGANAMFRILFVSGAVSLIAAGGLGCTSETTSPGDDNNEDGWTVPEDTAGTDDTDDQSPTDTSEDPTDGGTDDDTDQSSGQDTGEDTATDATTESACCVQNSCLSATQSQCDSGGGTFYEGQSCASDPCGGGGGNDGGISTDAPCCFPNSPCQTMDIQQCQSQGGAPQIASAGDSCSAVDCSSVQPCCLSANQCQALDESQCNTFGGESVQANTCSAVNCSDELGPTGACCIQEFGQTVCSEISQDRCNSLSGNFTQSASCPSMTSCP